MTPTKSTAVPTFENSSILAVTSHADVRLCSVRANSISAAISLVHSALSEQHLPSPQILDISAENNKVVFMLTAPTEVLEAQSKALSANKDFEIDPERRSTVTVTCQGSYASNLIDTLLQKLEEKNIRPRRVLPGALSVTFLVAEHERTTAVQLLHL